MTTYTHNVRSQASRRSARRIVSSALLAIASVVGLGFLAKKHHEQNRTLAEAGRDYVRLSSKREIALIDRMMDPTSTVGKRKRRSSELTHVA